MSRNTKTYTDFDLAFIPHPITGDVVKVADVIAVKQSIQNIIRTNFNERPFNPLFGSQVENSLFELGDAVSINRIERDVKIAIENYEPRVILTHVIATDDFDNNTLTVNIRFELVNVATEVDYDIILNRLR